MTWQRRVVEAQKALGISNRRLAEMAGVSIRTIERVFYTKDKHGNYVDNDIFLSTALRIINAVGLDPEEISENSIAIVVGKRTAELQAALDTVKEELNKSAAENIDLKLQISKLQTEIDLLKMKIDHKEQLLSLQERYIQSMERERN